jgi:hypothetical protein
MARSAGRGAAWGSVLPVDGFAAIRSVGFEPVGQVFGAAVYPAHRHGSSQLREVLAG